MQAGAERAGDADVVDAPADVAGAGVVHETPPGVMPAVFVKFTKGVDESGADEIGKALPLLLRETVVPLVGLRIGQVDFCVRHVEIAAEDYRFFGFQRFEIREKIAVPLHAIVQPRQVPFGVGGINIHQKKIPVLGCQHAAFAVVHGHAHAGAHADRLDARENGRAGVAFFLRWIPVLPVVVQQ